MADDMDMTINAREVAEQQQQKRQRQNQQPPSNRGRNTGGGGMNEVPAETEFELYEKFMFGRSRKDLNEILSTLGTGYLQEQEIAVIRKLYETWVKLDDIERHYLDDTNADLSNEKDRYKQRILSIVQASKARNGFMATNWNTQRVHQSEDVNQFMQQERRDRNKTGIASKLKRAVKNAGDANVGIGVSQQKLAVDPETQQRRQRQASDW